LILQNSVSKHLTAPNVNLKIGEAVSGIKYGSSDSKIESSKCTQILRHLEHVSSKGTRSVFTEVVSIYPFLVDKFNVSAISGNSVEFQD
jgi:hypothetical protein